MIKRITQTISTELEKIRKRLTGEVPGGFLPPDSGLDGADGGGSGFPEIRSLRLTGTWRAVPASVASTIVVDQRIFRQFELAADPSVTLDFWYRGFPLSVEGGQAFCRILTGPHVLDPQELFSIAEALGPIGEGTDASCAATTPYRIEGGEIGSLRGRLVLSLRWEHAQQRRKFMSLFQSPAPDGRTIHEVHFSAPAPDFPARLGIAIDTFRSIEWTAVPATAAS